MIEKVKVTQEQANEIGDIKDIAYAIDVHSFNKRPDKEIAGLSTADLARALLIGYEVEKPPFVIGGWKRYWKTDCVTGIGQVTAVDHYEGWVRFDGSNKELSLSDVAADATPEEIKAEQERRKWAEIDREIGEFWDGDIALDKFGKVLHTTEEMEAAYQMGDLSGFHPASSYISFGDGDSND